MKKKARKSTKQQRESKRSVAVERRHSKKATQRPPRSLKEFLAMPRSFQDQWNRIVQVPTMMRAQRLSLPKAARQFGLSPKTVLRLAPSAFRKSGRQYKVRPSDRLLRVLLIPSKQGLREIALKDSREASFVGEYWNAVEKYLVRGDSSALQRLGRRTVKDATGKRVRLLFNLDELKRQGSAGVLRFESVYGRRA